MPTQDSQMAWMRKRKRWLAWPDLAGGLIVEADGAHTEGTYIAPPRDSDFALFEVADYGRVGLRFAAAADVYYPYVPIPYDLDPRYELGFRINFTQSAAVSVGVTWILKVGVQKKDVAMLAEDSTSIKALDTVIAEKNAGGTAWENLWTARGIQLATTHQLTRAQIEDGADFLFSIEADVVDATIADVTLLQLEMDYVPQLCWGPGSESDAPLKSTGNNA